MSQEKNVISDKVEVKSALDTIKSNNEQKFTSGTDTVGVVIDGFPIVPIGSQIFLEHAFTDKTKGGIISDKPILKFPYPKVIGYGGLVKSVKIGDRICLKPNTNLENMLEEISNSKFHIIYEHSIVGIYRGTTNEEEYINSQVAVKPTIIV